MATPRFPFTGITPVNEIGNLAKLADYLVEVEGFTAQAAAGVASVIAGESSGNPESHQSGGSGVGLIQWTPGSTMLKYGAHLPTGNATADFNNQLPALVKYGKSRGGWASLKSAKSATQAAAMWSRMEAPAVANSDRRDTLIPKILAAMGNPPQGTGGGGGGTALSTGSGFGGGPATATEAFFPFPGGLGFLGGIWHDITGVPSTIGDVAQSIEHVAKDFGQLVTWLTWLFDPGHWLRVFAFLGGALFIVVGLYFLSKALGAPPITDTIQEKGTQAASVAMLVAK